jgi:hypothetical protein
VTALRGSSCCSCTAGKRSLYDNQCSCVADFLLLCKLLAYARCTLTRVPHALYARICQRADQHCESTEGEPKETPPYMLTESLSTQRLWHQTAGRRPRQPSTEREFFEQMWQKNFSESSVRTRTHLNTVCAVHGAALVSSVIHVEVIALAQ